MPLRNISLTEYHDHFVRHLVASGRFRSANEVLQAGLRLLEQQTQADEERLELLRRLATDGLDTLAHEDELKSDDAGSQEQSANRRVTAEFNAHTQAP
jgi:antitoxin ParD1/3/4